VVLFSQGHANIQADGAPLAATAGKMRMRDDVRESLLGGAPMDSSSQQRRHHGAGAGGLREF